MAGPEPYPCGTRAAYARHKRRGETPCDACHTAARAASREKYHRNLEQSRTNARLYQRSMAILARMHREEWRELFETHRDTRRHQDPDAPYRTIRSRAVNDANNELRRNHPTEHAVILSALRTNTKDTP